MASDKIDINNLIEKAEELVYNGNMNTAHKCIIPIQDIEDEKGGYHIYLVAVRDKEEFEERFLKED